MAAFAYFIVIFLFVGASGCHNHTHSKECMDTWPFKTLFFLTGIMELAFITTMVMLGGLLVAFLFKMYKKGGFLPESYLQLRRVTIKKPANVNGKANQGA